MPTKKAAPKKLAAKAEAPAALPHARPYANFYGSRLVSRAEAVEMCAAGWFVRADHGSRVRVACDREIWKAAGGR